MQWVVAFKGSRDAYQVPLALAEGDKLAAFVTDWYSPFDTKWFRGISKLLPARALHPLRKRFRSGLPSRKVHTRPFELLRTKLNVRAASDVGDNRIGVLAGALAADTRAGLLSYSYYAHAAFNHIAARETPKVIFQVHPHPRSIRNLLSEEIQLNPEGRESLEREIELSLDDKRFAQLSEEPLLAGMCLAASEFTKRTLVENGVSAEKIRVVPYGVDLTRFHPAASNEKSHGSDGASDAPFRVLFAGQMIQRKGLSYLLEAWKRLALPHAELILVGRGGADGHLLAKYEGLYQLKVASSVEHLRELYQTSDVCCLPSLIEGFGLVYLEALACGTPIIATPNTGAADMIRDGEEGFIVPIRDTQTLMEKLSWCYENRRELGEMRARARRVAERHTWEAFRGRIRSEIAEFERRSKVI